MNQDYDAFINSILEVPEDDFRRHVFADWLDDVGDTARAEFIRVQCRLPICQRDLQTQGLDYNVWTRDPEYVSLKTREEVLLDAHSKEWAKSLHELNVGQEYITFKRGLVQGVDLGIVSDKMIAVLMDYPTLEELEIEYPTFNDEGLAEYATLPNLRTLRINGNATQLSEECLEGLAEAPRLVWIFARFLPDEVVHQFREGRTVHFRSLPIHDQERYSQTLVNYVSRWCGAHHDGSVLSLSLDEFFGEDLVCFSAIPGINCLVIKERCCLPIKVINRSLASLKEWPELKALVLQDVEIECDFGFLAELVGLQELELSMTDYSPEPIESLINALVSMPNLIRLEMGYNIIHNQLYESALSVKTLHKLRIFYEDDLTEDHLSRLIELPHLEEVDFFYCGQITNEVAQRLATRMPNIRVIRNNDLMK